MKRVGFPYFSILLIFGGTWIAMEFLMGKSASEPSALDSFRELFSAHEPPKNFSPDDWLIYPKMRDYNDLDSEVDSENLAPGNFKEIRRRTKVGDEENLVRAQKQEWLKRFEDVGTDEESTVAAMTDEVLLEKKASQDVPESKNEHEVVLESTPAASTESILEVSKLEEPEIKRNAPQVNETPAASVAAADVPVEPVASPIQTVATPIQTVATPIEIAENNPVEGADNPFDSEDIPVEGTDSPVSKDVPVERTDTPVAINEPELAATETAGSASAFPVDTAEPVQEDLSHPTTDVIADSQSTRNRLLADNLSEQDKTMLMTSFAPSRLALDDGRSKKRQRSKSQDDWAGWITMGYPLNKPEGFADVDRTSNIKTPTFATTLVYRPSKWFAKLELYKYLDESAQGVWDPDFAYKFGYEDYGKNRISFDYYNGGRNRLNPNEKANQGLYTDTGFTYIDEGTITLAYNLPTGDLPNWLSLTHSSSVGSTLRFKSTPKVDFYDSDNEEWKRKEWQQSYSLYSWYNLTDTFYVAGTVYYYPEGNQMPWHPDFTYEFGIADWSPGKLSLEYGNYSEYNRFANNNLGRTSNFFDGSLSLSLYWQF